MIRKISILIFLIVFLPGYFLGQDNTFYRKYNLGGMQGGLQLATTSDGGFVATGQHEGNGSSGGCDVYVYRVDICGNIVWFKLYGLGSTDGGKSINQTSDGGFIVSGHYNGGQGFNLKLDSDGNAEWLKAYSGMSWVMYSVEADNGDYICLGHDGSSTIVFRCGSNGEVIWSRYMSGVGSMGLYLKELSNGDIVFTSVQNDVGKDFFVTRLTAVGNVVWSMGYGTGWGDTDHTSWSNRGTVDEVSNLITLTCPTFAGGQGGENVLVAQLELTSGGVLWSKSYGGGGSDQSRDIAPHPGGFAIVGNTNSYNVGADAASNITESMLERDILLFDIDEQGNLQWTRTYGGSERDRGIGVQYNIDNGYTIAAFTGSPIFGNFDDSFDPLFMKTEGDGWVSCQMHSPVMNQADVSLTSTPSGSSSAFNVSASLPGFVENTYVPQDNYQCQSCSTVPIFQPSDTMVCVGETIQFINTTQIGLTCFQQWYVEGQAYNGGNNLSYVFNAPGDYTVELFSTCGGAASTYEIVIHVYEIGSSFTTSDYNGFGVSCNGSNDGHIQVNGTGGYLGANPNYTISWLDGIQGFYRPDLIAGVYEYTLMDSIGCSFTEQIVISEPTDLLLEVVSNHNYNGFDISCYGLNDGGVSANIAGGVAPYSFEWINPMGNIQMSIENLPIGVYNCQTIDANGCIETNQSELIQPEQILGNVNIVSNYNGFDVSCFGSTDGSIMFDFIGGVLPISAQLSGMSVVPSSIISNVGAGYNNIVLTDMNGCVENIPVEIEQPSPLGLYLTATEYFEGFEISCFGLSDGEVGLDIVGGVAPMNVQWSNGINDQLILSNLSSGYYSVEVVDFNGCLGVIGIDLDEPSLLEADFEMLSDFNGFQVSCFGSSDGAVAVIPVGGTGDYSIQWSNGYFGPIQSNLAAGSYAVLVDDSNECGPISLNIDITEPSSLSGQLSVVSDYNGEMISCYGFSDAQATIAVTGGMQPYQWLWEDGSASQFSFSNNGTGYLNCQVTDQNNCIFLDSVFIDEPLPIEGSITSIVDFSGYDISCFDSQNAILELTMQGGTGNSNVLWANGQTTIQSNGWGDEVAHVLITDVNGCSQTLTYDVRSPPEIHAIISPFSNFNGSNISCNGASDGQLEVLVYGGVGQYQYLWSNGDVTSVTSNNLGEGIYGVTVTDGNQCFASASYDLYDPEPILLSVQSVVNYNGFDVSCYGQNDGGVHAEVMGGSGFFVFEWQNSQAEAIGTTSDLYNLLAGYYTVSVTDINNCGPFSQEITLSSPSELTIQMSVVSDYNGFHLSCFNSSDGQALATPNGGLPPYLYSWTDQSSAELSAIDLSAGTVFCQVVDQNGCQSIGQIEIVPPPPLQQTVSVVSDYNGSQISCFDSFDGSAQVATVGGTGIYQHQWSNGQTGTVSINLEPIGYWVESTDENECEILTSFTILPPDTLEVMPYITSNYNGSPISCYQQSDAVVSAIVVGGTGAYQVTWQTQNQSGVGNVASGLPSGSITFLIMDENGCSVSETIDIDEPDELILSLNVLSDYSGFGVSCSGSQNGFIAALVSGGTGDFAVTWSNGQEGFINESLGGGMYSAQVTDENGCVSDELIVEITEPDELIVSDYFHSIYNGFGVSCYGADDGWIALTTTGGVEPINFAWSNGELTEDLTDISAGYYNCQILDANLCQTNQIVVLNEPNEIDLQFEYVKDFCSLGTGIFQPSFNGVVGQTTVYIDGVMQPDGMSQYCCFTGNDQILFSVEDENGCQGDSIFIFPNIEAPVINLNVLSNNNVCEDFTKVQLIPSSNYYPVWYSIPGHQNLEILDEYSLLIQITSFGTVPIEVIGEIYPGCSSTGNVEIEVLPTMKVFVPNSFTPGSDNVNDGFFIVGENIEHLEWTIFDRWGGVMHVNNEVKGYWNGTNQNNGLDCIQGVYQYTYRAESYCGEVKEGRGHIVLLR